MAKVLTFRVGIKNLGNKFWRKIEISDLSTLADLAYTILASFGSLASHLYDMEYKKKIYDCWVLPEEVEPYKDNATITAMDSLSLAKGDKLKMQYDFGATTEFVITFLGSQDMKKGAGKHYPYIVSGAGQRMLEDTPDFILKDIVESIEKQGEQYFCQSEFTGHTVPFVPSNYNIEVDNLLLKDRFRQIKAAYEQDSV